MNHNYLLLLLALCIHAPLQAKTTQGCPESTEQVNASPSLAELVACFASPLPSIRDEYAFTEFSRILRKGEVPSDELIDLTDYIQQQLTSPNITSYHKAFLTLGLAEIARVDRKKPFLSEAQRNSLVTNATTLFTHTTDYTGYDEQYGYIHQIAHTADLVMQLSLNKRISQAQLISLADALQTVINPKRLHFYHNNEPDRLARACVYLFLREEVSDDFIEQWVTEVTKAPHSSWQQAYQGKAGLAALHNVQSFLGRLLFWTYEKQNERIALIHEHSLKGLKKVR